MRVIKSNNIKIKKITKKDIDKITKLCSAYINLDPSLVHSLSDMVLNLSVESWRAGQKDKENEIKKVLGLQ